MRKIAFCLISFLTLSLPCTMSWGDKYFQLLNKSKGSYLREKRGEIEQILGDLMRCYSAAGNILVFEMDQDKSKGLRYVYGLNPSSRYVVLVSGGRESDGRTVIANADISDWRTNSVAVGWETVLSAIQGYDLRGTIQEIYAGKMETVRMSDLQRVADGLYTYLTNISDSVSEVVFNYDIEKRADEHLNGNVVINQEAAALGLRIIRAIASMDNKIELFETLRTLFVYLDLVSSNVSGSADAQKFIDACKSIVEDTTEGYNGTGAQGAEWIKKCTHTEVMLHWLSNKEVIKLKGDTPILSLKNPCQSCARLPWLQDWIQEDAGIGFLWVKGDGDRNLTAGDRVKNTTSEAHVRTEKNGDEKSANGKAIRSTEAFYSE